MYEFLFIPYTKKGKKIKHGDTASPAVRYSTPSEKLPCLRGAGSRSETKGFETENNPSPLRGAPLKTGELFSGKPDNLKCEMIILTHTQCKWIPPLFIEEVPRSDGGVLIQQRFSPKLILVRIIFKPGGTEFLFEPRTTDVHIIT